jgi:hypothetical protein
MFYSCVGYQASWLMRQHSWIVQVFGNVRLHIQTGHGVLSPTFFMNFPSSSKQIPGTLYRSRLFTFTAFPIHYLLLSIQPLDVLIVWVTDGPHRIWGSHSGGYEEFCLQRYRTAYSVESGQRFQTKMSSPFPALLAIFYILVHCLAYFSVLNMEWIYSSETSVNIQRTTRSYIPEDISVLQAYL